ncbi:hypothetical protein DPMN_194273 [Dreissena polymorpha]|uniref:Uncharacterized protein n=1 Tax=Dreissena polymorpha TaxID=45954 RepID=A0A9D4BES9_DREPO|nr:hypothetical protein DPMN_194273 [Dreissena polymorpha]
MTARRRISFPGIISSSPVVPSGTYRQPASSRRLGSGRVSVAAPMSGLSAKHPGHGARCF